MIKLILKLFISIVLLQYTSSCKEGVTGGNIISSFQGVKSYTVLSPTAVKLDWVQQSKYKEYQVFELGQAEPLEVTIFDNYIVEGLNPNTEYVFKVIAIDQSNESFGGDQEIRVRTYPDFTGITSIERDIDDNIVVNWDFPHSVYRYHIFKHENSKPTALTTSDWNNNSIILTSNTQSHTFSNLAGSTLFYFQVHVEYRPGEFTRPDQEVTESTPTSFPDPLFNLPAVTIGSLPFATINPVINASFSEENYTSQFFHGITALSDPLTGSGVLSFLDSANLGLGKIDNISLNVNYNDGAVDETFVQSGLSTYIKGKSPVIDQPLSEDGFTKGTSRLGKSMASGDFNCDGFKDLAVGMPDASVGSLGVKVNDAGAIYIYYSVTEAGVTKLYTDIEPKVDPVRKGKDPQIITFSDSVGYEDFGFSMSSGGNFNGDLLGGNPCEDLIVGAPRMRTGTNKNLVTGAAFVFFGNKNGLSASQTYSNIQDNVGTCNGILEDSSCSAVRLWPDYSKWPSSVFPGGYDNIYGIGASGVGWTYTRIDFGYSVNFIGDFNGDGYDDLAVGAPEADWDGEVLSGAPGESAYLQNVGYVMVFFGSKFGLGYDNVDATQTSAQFPFVKIFPPIPQEGMRFGHSISNGADVNGNHRILGSDSKYHGGSDFVVGAPGFYYPNPASLPDEYDAVAPAGSGWTNNYTAATSYYGFSQNNPNAVTGAAFLFFGRDFSGASKTATVEFPSSSDFWSCGNRSFSSNQEHYSCLSEAEDYRILFPRNNTSKNFGSAVAILGGPTHYDAVDVNPDPNTAIDGNGDGYADIIVAASSGGLESGAKTNTGVLWQYFGNHQKYYHHDFANSAATSATNEYIVGAADCSSFSKDILNDTDNKANCRPTLLQSNSFQSGARLGLSNEAITVSDISGDELMDVIVGAPYDSANGSSAGAVLIFTSDISRGITSNYKKLYSTAGGDDTELGYSVAVGNFDGDKYSSEGHYNDVAAGGPGDDSHRAGGGAGHLFLTNGFHIASFKSDSDIQVYDDLGSPQQLGYQRSFIVGDINGDGFDDAAAHSVRYDSKGNQIQDGIIYFGSKDYGLVTSSTCLANPSDYISSGDNTNCYPKANRDLSTVQPGIILPQLIAKYETQNNLWANFVRPAGDVNGDGFGDVIFFDGSGRYELFFGSSSGIISTDRPQWIPSSGNPQIITSNFSQVETSGLSNTSILNKSRDNRDLIKQGDFNSDGYSDIVILNAFASSEKRVDGVGAPEPWLCTNPPPDPGDTKTIEKCNSGAAVEYHGLAVVFYGSNLGLQTPSMDTANFNYGDDVDLSDSSTYVDIYDTESGTAPCDVNNNCKVTLIRNPVFKNIEYGYQRLGHFFGASSTVLSVDTDNYDDLLIGAYGFEDISCYGSESLDSTPMNYGRIYVFRGGAGGLVAASRESYYDDSLAGACPSADNDTDLALKGTKIRALQPARYEDAGTTVSERKNREFGKAMSVAGDINGDGFEDLIVGANQEDINGDVNSGALYVFYGPLCEADNNPTYATTYAQEPANLNKQLKLSDIDLGAVPFGTECQTSAGKLPWQKFYIKGKTTTEDYSGGNVLGGRKGKSDINGDGFDDIIVGSPYWDDDFNSVDNVGRGIIYFGSSLGLYTEDFPSINVVTNDDGQLRPYSLHAPIDQANSYFFANSFSMGDYNNDGTADILVPSYWFDGLNENKGINVGVFFTFY